MIKNQEILPSNVRSIADYLDQYLIINNLDADALPCSLQVQKTLDMNLTNFLREALVISEWDCIYVSGSKELPGYKTWQLSIVDNSFESQEGLVPYPDGGNRELLPDIWLWLNFEGWKVIEGYLNTSGRFMLFP